MPQAALNLPMTAAQFLAWEETQTVKHEFVRGEVVAMAGAGKAHVALALNAAIGAAPASSRHNLPHLHGRYQASR